MQKLGTFTHFCRVCSFSGIAPPPTHQFKPCIAFCSNTKLISIFSRSHPECLTCVLFAQDLLAFYTVMVSKCKWMMVITNNRFSIYIRLDTFPCSIESFTGCSPVLVTTVIILPSDAVVIFQWAPLWKQAVCEEESVRCTLSDGWDDSSRWRPSSKQQMEGLQKSLHVLSPNKC